MTYIGIGYTGNDPSFLRDIVERNLAWLKGDRLPRFFGDHFLMLYDSNTAREFVRKCRAELREGKLHVYPVGRPYE